MSRPILRSIDLSSTQSIFWLLNFFHLIEKREINFFNDDQIQSENANYFENIVREKKVTLLKNLSDEINIIQISLPL